MSTALIEAQRRTELRTVQIETAVRRERLALRKLDTQRAQAEAMHVVERKTFDEIKGALLKSKRMTHPATQLERTHAVLGVLREKKQLLDSSVSAIEKLKTEQAQIAANLGIRHKQLDAVEVKTQAFAARARNKAEIRDIEERVEGSLARAAQEKPLAPPGTVISLVPGIRAQEVQATTRAEHSTLNRLAEQMKELTSCDSLLRSCVEMQFSISGVGHIGVELVRKGDRRLEVKLTPERPGDRRRLWRAREGILEALTEAGYSVGRFIIAAAG